MSEANKTEELHHTQAAEQIHNLFSIVADLQQKVLSLENGSKQSVSDTVVTLYTYSHHFPLADSFWRLLTNYPDQRQISMCSAVFCDHPTFANYFPEL